MKTIAHVTILVASACLAGCATTKGTARASMSLGQAICEIQNAIITTRRPEATRAGIKPSEATATLALGIKDVKSGEVGAKLKLGVVEWAPKGSWSRENTSLSTLQIKFVPGDTHYLIRTTAGVSSVTIGEETLQLPDCSEFQ